ncbi:nitroreductase family deazaflavin-dependent oxidoreductase [Terracoccus luteus]|uniref:Deazaflavin-dependent oxidoreductase (Nitroreductase family) n=1 Tax=Terracoccus luteus TaxID=53356 RepID=A0A839PRT1_9MICO|nr:nitroreductase family deazaflavin-dependent oxidoreductase [Terracoccus luteus]MBB2985773.1 deazaflavin-dependent oxidoreductase (nitroreductase family) [Terracoccus luteus]MCP2171425.1 deazaflavin-dependent oxidoreductase (nitroreductase family) [Terracoccus luteus]
MSDQQRDSQYVPSTSQWVREQVEEIERTGTTASVHIQDRPVVMLTMRGAKSGATRKVPLMRVERDGSYAAVASQGGAPTHPQWYHNLKAHPDIELMDGERSFPVRARELDGEEREQWWQPCVDAFPPYAEYQTKTDRLIPVFVLEPR